MKLANLIAIAAIASVLTQSSVFAQETPAPETPGSIAPAAEKSSEKSSEKSGASVPVTEKKYSIGPAIEFGGGGTSFGIKGKASVSDQISVRPMILFGYKPSVSRSDINQLALNGGTTQANIDTTTGQQNITDVINNIGSGIGYGLAVTYDFKSPDSKIVGYVGPRILFGSASGSNTSTSGGQFTTSTNETNIGLTAGADYAIAPDITAGVTATYNFSRSGTTSLTTSGVTNSTNFSGGTFNVGINASYNF
jgi:opacity protein-like surface antigen